MEGSTVHMQPGWKSLKINRGAVTSAIQHQKATVGLCMFNPGLRSEFQANLGYRAEIPISK